MLMLGHAEAARSSVSSYGYQQAQRYLCLIQIPVNLQVQGEEVLDKNGQFILREFAIFGVCLSLPDRPQF